MSSIGNIQKESSLRTRCHIATNIGGDTFVGIRITHNMVQISFPMGYRLGETDEDLRKDIYSLIKTLDDLISHKDGELLSISIDNSQNEFFPMQAYRNVIEYYFSIDGHYYTESELIHETATRGKIDWKKTILRQMPLVQIKDNISSFIYTNFTIRKTHPDDEEIITRINQWCVYEAFSKIGWMYTLFCPSKFVDIDLTVARNLLINKLSITYDDRVKLLFKSMLDIINYVDNSSFDDIYYGVASGEILWERMIDKAFGISDKSEYLPKTEWRLKYSNNRKTNPLLPDTIMIENKNIIILDAKYYKYGMTGFVAHLPETSSIHKQITYGEYVENHCKINHNQIYNAFILPYNMEKIPFKDIEGGVFLHIGEARASWKKSNKNYESVQGILLDTNYLMNHYSNFPIHMRNSLIRLICDR